MTDGTAGATAALDLTAVRKAYGKVEAVRGVSLRVMQGEVVGLLGPNGAGKSTLFQMAAGLFEPDAGEVKLFGLGYRGNAPTILRRLGVVFQTRSVDLDMTVKANLAFHGNLFGLRGAELAERVAETTALLEIGDLLKKPVRALSGGNQRRVEIARALLNRPDLLIMDEPTVGLDPATRRLLVAHIRRIATERRTAVLWATHLIEEVEGADRLVLLAGGQVLDEGTPAELVARSGAPDLTGAFIALTGGASG